jgi:hypothetical protein
MIKTKKLLKLCGRIKEKFFDIDILSEKTKLGDGIREGGDFGSFAGSFTFPSIVLKWAHCALPPRLGMIVENDIFSWPTPFIITLLKEVYAHARQSRGKNRN